MASGLNKERVLFFVGAALFLWVMLKFGLYWQRRLERPGTPKVSAPSPARGDPNIRELLAIPSLDHYTGRGSRHPFRWDATQPAQFFVRAAVHHSFRPSLVRSRYSFECRMVPHAVREVRLQLPPATQVTQVFSSELDPDRHHGRQGDIYVIPVRPTAEKRCFYRCQVTLETQQSITLPTKWVTPVISCTEAMPNVACEVGHVALSVPGKGVEFIPINEDPKVTHLERVSEVQWPQAFASEATKGVYRYTEPRYKLTVQLRSTEPPEVAVKPKEPVVKPKEPVVKPKEPEPEPKLAIEGPPIEAGPPLKLTGILRIEAPEPRRQAVLRHKDSGEYYRKFEGDTVLDDLRIAKITDNSVVLLDTKRGKRFTLSGRFEQQYER